MAFIHSPKIVTDGLVLALDAGNIKSYASGSLLWTDLSGNNRSGSLVNGPTFNTSNGGSIVFDGSNDFIQLGNILNVGTSDFTIETWFYKETKSNSFPKLVSKGIFQGGGWRVSEGNGISFNFQYGNPQLSIASPSTLVNNSWNHAIITRLTGSIVVYANGSGSSATVVSNDLSTNSYTYQLATSPNAGENWKGRIAVHRHYNIGFTRDMVLQNFNAQRSRFGI